MEYWINPGLILIAYLAAGMLFASIREVWNGAKGRQTDTETFLSIVVFWPFMFPVLWLVALCKWCWNVGFSRNLPPSNQHPTAKPFERRKR